MKKTAVFFLIGCMFLGACQTKPAEKSSITSTAAEENPFDSQAMEQDTSSIQASYGFGIVNGNEETKELNCTNGEADVEIEFENGDTECQAGVLLFVDGILQKYQTKDQDQLQVMHTLKLKPAAKESFHFYFTPEIGVSGKKHQINALAVFEPDFTATKDNMAYGNYGHGTPFGQWVLCTDELQNQKKFYQEFQTQSVSTDEHSYLCRIFQGDTEITDMMQAKDETSLDIHLKGETADKKKYRLCLLINNQLVEGAFQGNDYAEVTASKTEEAVVSADFSPKDLNLKENNTIYACYVPYELDTSVNGLMADKSDSILLLN